MTQRPALTIALLLTSSFVANADIIDQNQPNDPDYMADFNQGDLAQSFRPGFNNVSGAGIFLQPGIGTTDTVTISLWDALPNVGGANILASASGTGTQGTWFDVFWAPAVVTPGVTYFLVFTGNTTLAIAGDTGNPYPSGQVYANTGFGSFPTFDYTFRTYSAVGAVPEIGPGAAVGVSLFAGLLAFRRRRK